MKPKKGHSSLRKGRYSKEGHVYHVTFTTLNRQPISPISVYRADSF